MKKVIIESLITSQKIAVVQDGKLEELLIESNLKNKLVSNIYRGIVKKILPGIEACFIDIGFKKMAYLQLKKDHNIKCGQEIMVQVNKEEIGTKAAKLTTEISLAGRYLVYIPSNDRITISNKIEKEKERFRLKNILKDICKDSHGIIIRTEAIGCSKEELEEDLNLLKLEYENILKEYKLGLGPKLLYKSLDFASKYIKENLNDDIEKIVTNDKAKYDEIKSILNQIDKNYIKKLYLEENRDIFDLYRIQNQIQNCLDKKVWLKSGGYLIIEKTEALTVIDVNTGRFTGNIKLSETIFKTNIEAATEIARQLRLRDIGGIIIIDFIDMKNQHYKKEVLKTLNENLQKDKRKSEILGFTKLGLVEVARRRQNDSIQNYYLQDCIECMGYGTNKSLNVIIDEIEKEVIKIKEHTSYTNITLILNKNLLKELNKKFNNIIEKISEKYGIIISLQESSELYYEKINIIYNT